ncbi:MAG: hypothetical protein V7K98_13890 [Nostoc sp.]
MPNAQCPMPNAQCPMPNAQCPIPKYKISKVAHSDLTIHNGG